MYHHTLPFVEIMITQACNLSCQGCTNYSDLKHSGYVPWAQGRQWFDAWKSRVDLPDIGIMGGEPLINPEWRDWVYGLRSMFPDSQLRFTTNGLLLAKNPDITKIMLDIGNVVFKITVHLDDDDLESWIHNCFQQHDWQAVTEHEIDRWQTENRVRFQVNRPQNFLSPFKGSYHDMAPWMSEPEQAFDRCIQQTCPLMYQGRLYKCSTSALLLDTLTRFGRPNWSQWQPFITGGLGPDDPDVLIDQFIAKFGQPETICAQCPTHQAPIIDHRFTVRVGKA